MLERLTWMEIKRRYPHMWVFLDEVEYGDSHAQMKSAIVVDAVADDEVDNRREKMYEDGKDFLVRRTADGISTGVIHCENVNMSVH